MFSWFLFLPPEEGEGPVSTHVFHVHHSLSSSTASSSLWRISSPVWAHGPESGDWPMPDPQTPGAHGSSIHHADRNMALSHATQDLLDPPLKLNDLDKETQVPLGPHPWGSWNQHLLHRWVQEPEPGDSSPLDPLSQGSWTQHSGYHLLFLYYSVSLNIIPKTRSVRASSFHFCLFWKAFILA